MDIKNWCSGMYVALYSPLVTEKLHDFGKITIALCLTFLRKIGVIHVFPGLLGGFGEGRGAVLGTQCSFSEGSLPAPLPRAGSQQTEHGRKAKDAAVGARGRATPFSTPKCTRRP